MSSSVAGAETYLGVFGVLPSSLVPLPLHRAPERRGEGLAAGEAGLLDLLLLAARLAGLVPTRQQLHSQAHRTSTVVVAAQLLRTESQDGHHDGHAMNDYGIAMLVDGTKPSCDRAFLHHGCFT